MLFSLITGPGNHSNYLIRALKEKYAFDFTEYWPKYYYSDNQNPSGSRLFDLSSFALYGFHNKVRFLTNKKWHLDLLFPLYDLINSRKISGKNLIAWPQVSLHSMKRIKAMGGRIILEQPMCHVGFWNDVSRHEHSKYQMNDTVSFSLLMVDRMMKEYQLANQIVVHSSFAKKTFTDNGADSSRVTVCPLGIDLPGSNKDVEKDRTKKKLQVLYVGRVELLKGVHYLLEAFDSFGNFADLHIAGPVQTDFLTIANRYNHKVKFHGQLTRERLNDLYSQCDLLIFPSLYDAFGLTIIEGMSHQLPVIATTHSAAPDIISNGEDGFVINPFSSELLSEKIAWAIENREELKEMGIRARAKVINTYSYEQYSERVLSIIQDNFE